MSNLTELSIEYQGKDGKSNLIAESERLSEVYQSLKNSKNEKILECYIADYENVIQQFSVKYHQFYSNFIDIPDRDSKKQIAYAYTENVQIHLAKLQSQYNQLVYRKQQCDNNYSLKVAHRALAVTIVSSILSIIFTVCDVKYSKENLPAEIQQLTDSVHILGGKIEQQNELIKKYFNSISERNVTDKMPQFQEKKIVD